MEDRQLFTAEEEKIVIEFLNSCKQDLAVKRDVKNSCKQDQAVKREEKSRSNQNLLGFSGGCGRKNDIAFVNKKGTNESDC